MRKPGILLAMGSFMFVVACGGGGGGNGGGSGSGGTSNITSVTAACSPSTLQSGQTSQCSATVTGTDSFSSTVTWRASAGQISSSGLLTAPIVSKSKLVTVTAVSADIAVAGEEAGSVPVQIMVPPATSPAVPNSCSGQSIGGNGNEGGSVDDFGANALIGLGVFQQECGPACTNQSSSIPAVYYSCP